MNPRPNPNYHREAAADYHSERRAALDGLHSEPGDHIDTTPATCEICERETVGEEMADVHLAENAISGCAACRQNIQTLVAKSREGDSRDISIEIDRGDHQ